jgi:hypothetical protein
MTTDGQVDAESPHISDAFAEAWADVFIDV